MSEVRLNESGGGGGLCIGDGKSYSSRGLGMSTINKFPYIMANEKGFDLTKPEKIIRIGKFDEMGGVWEGRHGGRGRGRIGGRHPRV
ncbi:unnamed protein product [Prunus armeniaca]